jgi:hypothetical protein
MKFEASEEVGFISSGLQEFIIESSGLPAI